MGRADIHMHTTASDGLAPVDQVLDRITTRGTLDVIAITDHDTLEASLWAYERRGGYVFDIIPGVEVSRAEGHVLALWVTEPIPMGLSLQETAAAVHDQGGVAILAHPFHLQLSDVYRNLPRYWRHPEYLVRTGIDGLETFNAGVVVPGSNWLSRRFARQVELATVGGSDAHSPGAIGSGTTRFPGKNGDDLRTAIHQRQTIAQGHPWPLRDYWQVIRALPHWQPPQSVRAYLRTRDADAELA